MKYLLPLILLSFTGFTVAPKYALIDKKLAQPITYTTTVTSADYFKGYFAVESDKLKTVVAEIQKIAKDLETDKPKREATDYKIGSTTFKSKHVSLATQERLDVVVITDCGQIKTMLHLCDGKLSNANNLFYINTLLKYINDYL